MQPCPRCGFALEVGRIESKSKVSWISDRNDTLRVSRRFNISGEAVPAARCRWCDLILIDPTVGDPHEIMDPIGRPPS